MNNIDWQEIWMEQSRVFMETANKNIQQMLNNDSSFNPQKHMSEIQDWLKKMNEQWQGIYQNNDGLDLAKYWEAMAQISRQASDLMLEQWIKRYEDGEPVKSVKELYGIWLGLCHEIYMKNIQSNAYQQMYGDMLNDAMKFWMSALKKTR